VERASVKTRIFDYEFTSLNIDNPTSYHRKSGSAACRFHGSHALPFLWITG